MAAALAGALSETGGTIALARAFARKGPSVPSWCD